MASRSILEFFKPTKDSGDDRRLKSVPASVADLVEKEIRNFLIHMVPTYATFNGEV